MQTYKMDHFVSFRKRKHSVKKYGDVRAMFGYAKLFKMQNKM